MHGAGSLRGRVGVITAAESEAGQSLARTLANEGMSLVLIAQPGSQVRTLAESLEAEFGIRCFPASLDVMDPDAVDRIVMHAEQHVGAVDVLVNGVPGRLAEALEPTLTQRGRGLIISIDDDDPVAAILTAYGLNVPKAPPD